MYGWKEWLWLQIQAKKEIDATFLTCVGTNDLPVTAGNWPHVLTETWKKEHKITKCPER